MVTESEKEKDKLELTESCEKSDSDSSGMNDSVDNAEEEALLPEIGEDFEILELLGKGGMGSVYRALDKRINKEVAVKVLQATLANDKAALKRFEQEAEAAAGLEHPNLGATYEHGTTDDGQPYIVLDYYEGKSLAAILQDEGTLTADRALRLLKQISLGLSHAHSEGVIHRDLKPTNIIISPTEDGGEIARIVDFGIAKVMPKENRETHNLTETGEVFGSPNYMSPEQCLGFMLDNRSDVYSFGCLMYEMLTGDPPFGGSNPIQVVVKHINEDIKPFPDQLLANKMNKRLESITFRCLEKDQVNRYQTVEDLVNDLELVSEGKQPSKYKRQVKQKREFTKRQLIGTIVGLSAFVFYGGVSAAFFGQHHILFIMLFGILNLLVLGGMYVSFTTLKEHVSKIENLKHTGSGWWLTALSFFFGVICISVFPYSALGGIYTFIRDILHQYAFSWPNWMTLASLIAVIVNILSVLGALVSGIGFGVLRSKRKVTLSKFSLQFVAVATSLIVLSTVVFPHQVSQVCLTLANLSGAYVPPATRVMAGLAHELNKSDLKSALLLAEFEYRAGNYERALSLLNSGKDWTDSFDVIRLKVKILKSQKKFSESLAIASKYIDSFKPGNIDKRGFNLRGIVYEEMKDYSQAYKSYSLAAEEPYTTGYLINKCRMMCALGKYDDALVLLREKMENSSDKRLEFLAAMIKEKSGDISGARSSYKTIAGKVSYWADTFSSYNLRFSKIRNQKTIGALMNAYCYTKLNNKSSADQEFGKAQPLGQKDLAGIDLLKNTGLTPNWKPVQ